MSTPPFPYQTDDSPGAMSLTVKPSGDALADAERAAEAAYREWQRLRERLTTLRMAGRRWVAAEAARDVERVMRDDTATAVQRRDVCETMRTAMLDVFDADVEGRI